MLDSRQLPLSVPVNQARNAWAAGPSVSSKIDGDPSMQQALMSVQVL